MNKSTPPGTEPQSASDPILAKSGTPAIDAEAIRALAKLLEETGLSEIEIEHHGARLRVSRLSPATAAAPVAVNSSLPPASPPATPVAAAAAGLAQTGAAPLGAVPSPMVGTVYLSPAPGKPPFISVGKPVKEGDTLFIVEAMKTMNAIAAPRSGIVKEICVADVSPVEFGQILAVIA